MVLQTHSFYTRLLLDFVLKESWMRCCLTSPNKAVYQPTVSDQILPKQEVRLPSIWSSCTRIWRIVHAKPAARRASTLLCSFDQQAGTPPFWANHKLAAGKTVIRLRHCAHVSTRPFQHFCKPEQGHECCSLHQQNRPGIACAAGVVQFPIMTCECRSHPSLNLSTYPCYEKVKLPISLPHERLQRHH